jgi:hypothetical protein
MDYAFLERTIAASFVRCNVLPVQEALDHAALAVQHVRNVAEGRNIATNPATKSVTAVRCGESVQFITREA